MSAAALPAPSAPRQPCFPSAGLWPCLTSRTRKVMAGVDDVLGWPLSPRGCPEPGAVPVTAPSAPGSWVRGAKSCSRAWAVPTGDLSHVNVGAAGTVPSLDRRSRPPGAPGARAQRGPVGRGSWEPAPSSRPGTSQAMRHCGWARVARGAWGQT